MSLGEKALAVRHGVGLFRLAGRALLEVGGSDRERWLQGQISQDVAGLDPDGPRSGVYAFLLTPQGRIVTDLQVLARPGVFWLEFDAGALAAARVRLERFIVADDVTVVDRSDAWGRLALEGPRARELLEAMSGCEAPPAEGARHLSLAGHETVVAAYGWSGEEAFQLFVPSASLEAVVEALVRAGRGHGLVEAPEAVLELLRVEAGIPRFGAELDEEVLPAETGSRTLERAVSFSKGCYTGQEVVARMHSRRAARYRLMGMRIRGATPPPPGAAVVGDGGRIGEVTSAVLSPIAGVIALGYVKRPHDRSGARIEVEGVSGELAELPLVRCPSLARGAPPQTTGAGTGS